jgi:hypothetical protein
MGSYGLIPFDDSMIAEVRFQLTLGKGAGNNIEFQFMPKLKSESNTSTWEESDIWAVEPLKIHKGSGGKKLAMEWEYLASDEIWNCGKVAKTLKNLKTYFFEFTRETYPTAKIIYGTSIPSPTYFRIMDVSITYSDEIIFNNGMHPLHSRVSVSLELATNVNEPGGKQSSDAEGKLPVDPLSAAIFDWY